MKSKMVKKLLAGTLTVVLVAGTAACGNSAGTPVNSTAGTESRVEESEAAAGNEGSEEKLASIMAEAVGAGNNKGVEKSETVYVFTDANGKTKDVTVSAWLKNPDQNKAINDETSLTDLKVTEGDAVYSSDGKEVTWTSNGEDVYYQGKTDAKLPVNAEITYYLNGKEVSPEEIAGKSGEVRIHIAYTNNEKRGDVYVPFTAVTGLMFSNDDVSNVKVDNGTVVSEGKNTIVVGMGFPGLRESLATTKEKASEKAGEIGGESGQKAKEKIMDLDIPSEVDVTMDASEFNLDMCMTMVFSNLLEGEDTDSDEDSDSVFEELDKVVDELSGDGNLLADGATKLSDGIKTADDAMPELSDGTSQLASGVKEYTDGVSQVNDGAMQLTSGAASARDGSAELASGVAAYTEGVAAAAVGASQLAEALAAYRKSGAVPCTACRYCSPCPVGVDIPRNLALLNQLKGGLPLPSRLLQLCRVDHFASQGLGLVKAGHGFRLVGFRGFVPAFKRSGCWRLLYDPLRRQGSHGKDKGVHHKVSKGLRIRS